MNASEIRSVFGGQDTQAIRKLIQSVAENENCFDVCVSGKGCLKFKVRIPLTGVTVAHTICGLPSDVDIKGEFGLLEAC
ncbi:MAG: hypothetical protein WC831_03390 [Parcubacteria group bacterium]|jgi:hypothetical protein